VATRCDVVNQIAADYSVAGLVNGRIGRSTLKANDIDSNIVVVVDDIMGNAEISDVSIHHQRLARTGLEMMHFVAVNNQISDRSLRVGTVHGDPKAIAAASGSVAPGKSLLDVMDIVLQ